MRVPLAVRLLPGVAERVWFTPPRPSAGPLRKDEQRLEGVEPITVAVEGRPRPGFSVGEGPLVILAHGWGGRAAQMIELAEAAASSGFRAVAIDSPGHGTDEHPTSDGFQMAAGLGVVKARFGRPAAVVAHSIGAMATVLAFSERPPVAAVFLAPVLDLRDPLGIFSDRARLAPWTARSLRRRVQRFTGELWPAVTAGADADLPGTELLLVHDPVDPDATFSTSKALAHSRPKTRLVEAPGLGHNRLLRDRYVVEEVKHFLTQATRTRPTGNVDDHAHFSAADSEPAHPH